MFYSLFIPMMIGGMGVLQNTFNKRFATGLGLPLTLLINNLALLALSLLLLLALRFVPREALPELFKQKVGLHVVNWKYILPGTLGFLIIAAAPYAIDKVGATKVFSRDHRSSNSRQPALGHIGRIHYREPIANCRGADHMRGSDFSQLIGLAIP